MAGARMINIHPTFTSPTPLIIIITLASYSHLRTHSPSFCVTAFCSVPFFRPLLAFVCGKCWHAFTNIPQLRECNLFLEFDAISPFLQRRNTKTKRKAKDKAKHTMGFPPKARHTHSDMQCNVSARERGGGGEAMTARRERYRQRDRQRGRNTRYAALQAGHHHYAELLSPLRILLPLHLQLLPWAHH